MYDYDYNIIDIIAAVIALLLLLAVLGGWCYVAWLVIKALHKYLAT